MLGLGSEVVIFDLLWFLVIVGWILLIVIGLEADKPLSGGLPGHVDFAEARSEIHVTARDRLGATLSWVLFGIAALSLPVILWWVFAVHGR